MTVPRRSSVCRNADTRGTTRSSSHNPPTARRYLVRDILPDAIYLVSLIVYLVIDPGYLVKYLVRTANRAFYLVIYLVKTAGRGFYLVKYMVVVAGYLDIYLVNLAFGRLE